MDDKPDEIKTDQNEQDWDEIERIIAEDQIHVFEAIRSQANDPLKRVLYANLIEETKRRIADD